MSYLNDPRVLFAAERTLLAWQRTAIALMGFGFVVERFGLFQTMVSKVPVTAAQRGFSLWLGICLLTLGAGVLLGSARQFRVVLRSLSAEEIPPGYATSIGVWLNLVLAIVAVVLAVHFATDV